MQKGVNKKRAKERLPQWSSGLDFALPVQGAWVQSLVGERDPHAATKTQCGQILKK